MGLIQEFRDFAVKGNAVDLAVGVIIGAAFGKIVTSLTNDVIMPPIGMLLGQVDFSDLKVVLKKADATATPAVAEVAIRYGAFINVMLDFLIVSFCIFMMVKVMNKLRGPGEPKKA